MTSAATQNHFYKTNYSYNYLSEFTLHYKFAQTLVFLCKRLSEWNNPVGTHAPNIHQQFSLRIGDASMESTIRLRDYSIAFSHKVTRINK